MTRGKRQKVRAKFLSEDYQKRKPFRVIREPTHCETLAYVKGIRSDKFIETDNGLMIQDFSDYESRFYK